ncbi:GerAB/ArcD/ProY family transporter [Anaeroselena agilis]|uniref:GerAB/ArcD/ProY family transporter n=1 Tax=Anaeroselena agilis TaxID=3063788 RepID=A0ABU3NZ69_9FIRM|nr:GerAB/ArcD/ProY family transporter [Selenomonadales bacterium 4137-cl]
MMRTRWVSPLQFMVIAVNAMFGTSLLVLPRRVADSAHQDMWLAVLLASVFIAVSFRIAAALAARFPDLTAIEYHRILLGKFWGNVLNVAMLALMLAVIAQTIRISRIAVKIFLLDMTPSQVIVLAFLLLAVYAAQSGLGPVIRVQQLLLLFAHSAFVALVLLGLLEIETEHYTPLLAEGVMPVLKGSLSCWTAYSGPELIIGLLYPFLVRRGSLVRFGLAGIGAVTILFVLISGITLGILGPEETSHLLVPTIMAYRAIEIPDTFIERIDGYLMIVWIAVSFTALVNWLYFTGFAAARLMRLENARPVMALLVPVIAYLVTVPPDFYSVVIVSKWINYAGLAWGLGVLPLLLALAWRRKEG